MAPFTPFSDSNPPLAVFREYKITAKVAVIYIGILLIAILFFGFLLFKISESDINAAKLFRSHSIHSNLLAPASGTVTEIFVEEDQKIGKGDTILLFKPD